jgi:hypothetical protein
MIEELVGKTVALRLARDRTVHPGNSSQVVGGADV